MGDAERALGNHSGIVCIANRRDDIAGIVQTAEGTRDVRTLRFLYLIEQLAHIGGHGTHAEAIQGTVQHVSLDTGFVERLRPFAHGFIRILPKQQIYLFKTSAIGFHARKTTHLNDSGSYFHQLVNTGYIFSGTLPHVPEYQAELNFLFHTKLFGVFLYKIIISDFFYLSNFTLTLCHYCYGCTDSCQNITGDRCRTICCSFGRYHFFGCIFVHKCNETFS